MGSRLPSQRICHADGTHFSDILEDQFLEAGMKVKTAQERSTTELSMDEEARLRA